MAPEHEWLFNRSKILGSNRDHLDQRPVIFGPVRDLCSPLVTVLIGLSASCHAPYLDLYSEEMFKANRLRAQVNVAGNLQKYLFLFHETNLIHDESMWHVVNLTPILPPIIKKKAGRLTNARRRGPNKQSRVLRAVGCRCKYCKQIAHNRRRCIALGKAPARPTNRKRKVFISTCWIICHALSILQNKKV